MGKSNGVISNFHMCELVKKRRELGVASDRIEELERYLNKACNHLERLAPTDSEKLINKIRSIL